MRNPLAAMHYGRMTSGPTGTQDVAHGEIGTLARPDPEPDRGKPHFQIEFICDLIDQGSDQTPAQE
jgi:hypothetical protein